jgi:hypothetical protein
MFRPGGSSMTKTGFLVALIVTALIVTALVSMPAHAQQAMRVFVSGLGVDTNPCSVTQPCRTFQQAYNTVAANGEIDVLDPAGYGPLTITKGISIQAHGWGSITQTLGSAITITVTTSDPVTLNGLIVQGGGLFGIYITSGPSVQILNSVVRGFLAGTSDQSTTNGSNLLIEDTVASDNNQDGINIQPYGGGSVKATLSRVTANNNLVGIVTIGAGDTTIANSVVSNNSSRGVQSDSGVTWLARTVISGNATGVNFLGGVVNSYGDNYIRDNGTPVAGGSLTPVSTQ